MIPPTRQLPAIGMTTRKPIAFIIQDSAAERDERRANQETESDVCRTIGGSHSPDWLNGRLAIIDKQEEERERKSK